MGKLTPESCAGGPWRLAGFHAPARCILTIAVIAGLTLTVAACGRDKGPSLGERVIPLGHPVPKGGGRYQVGQPYEIGGKRYVPHEDPKYDRIGTASWYGELFHGRYTANGEIYDMDRLSAAHPTLPLPVYVHVTNLSNGRAIVVRVNDRGPFKKDRIIDLSRRSAEILGFKHRGVAHVRVRYLRRAPLNGDDSYERRYVASRGYQHYASKSGTSDEATIEIANAPPPLPDRRPDIAVANAKAEPAPDALAALVLEASPETTGSIPEPSRLAPDDPVPRDGPAIQAGSFRNKDFAMRAKVRLAGIGPVDVSEIDVGGESYYRVRVGPFPDAIAAAAALPMVTDAGYHGAKILLRN